MQVADLCETDSVYHCYSEPRYKWKADMPGTSHHHTGTSHHHTVNEPNYSIHINITEITQSVYYHPREEVGEMGERVRVFFFGKWVLKILLCVKFINFIKTTSFYVK